MVPDSPARRPIWDAFINLILPPRCVMTGEIVAEQGTLSAAAWRSLRFITPPFCACCGDPFDFFVDESVRCASCLADPPPFAVLRAALVYDDASRNIVLKFKHGDHLQAIPTLVPMLLRAGRDILPGVNIIVPVPLHRWRLLARRYNQAALLGWGIGRETGIRVIPDALLRLRHTPSQGHKNARDRVKNVRRAFAVRGSVDVAGQVVLLVDDVYTTGATVRECARVLMEAGAAEVRVLTVARGVRPGS